MRVYITGIAGFLGSHLADHWLKLGNEVWGCDDLSTGDPINIPDGALFEKLDIADLKPDRLDGVEVAYHCAAHAYEGLSVCSPALISDNIYAGSARVFSAAVAAGVRRVVFCSSMARYGEIAAPFHEADEPLPVDPYGLAKLGAERLLAMMALQHGIEFSIAVPHNIYGPRQRYVDPYRNVAGIMINRMLQGLQPVIYGDGSQVRCFTYHSDIVPALARMGCSAAASGQTINLGPDEGEISILELARLIHDLVVPNRTFAPIFLPDRPFEVRRATCSADKARRLMGYSPQVGLEEGLQRMVRWMMDRGARPFEYGMPIEIATRAPRSWVDRLI